MLPFADLGWSEHPYHIINAIETIGSQIAQLQRAAIDKQSNNNEGK